MLRKQGLSLGHNLWDFISHPPPRLNKGSYCKSQESNLPLKCGADGSVTHSLSELSSATFLGSLMMRRHGLHHFQLSSSEEMILLVKQEIDPVSDSIMHPEIQFDEQRMSSWAEEENTNAAGRFMLWQPKLRWEFARCPIFFPPQIIEFSPYQMGPPEAGHESCLSREVPWKLEGKNKSSV